MTRYLLDTNICVELLRTGSRPMMSRLMRCELDEVAISTITLAELQFGVAKSARPVHHQTLLAQFCAPLNILSFDHLAADRYGHVRQSLESAGKPIGLLDTLIANHAVALGLTLVTTNEREFQRVAGLRVENWIRK